MVPGLKAAMKSQQPVILIATLSSKQKSGSARQSGMAMLLQQLQSCICYEDMGNWFYETCSTLLTVRGDGGPCVE